MPHRHQSPSRRHPAPLHLLTLPSGSRVVIQWLFATLLLATLPLLPPSSICLLWSHSLPNAFALAHSLPPSYTSSNDIANSNFSTSDSGASLSVAASPSHSHLSPALIHPQGAPTTLGKSLDAPIADFESLLQRIDSISRRQLCTTIPFTVPLVAQSVLSLHQSAPVLPAASAPSLPILNPLPPLPPPPITFHHHQMVTIPMVNSVADYVRHSFADNERCRRTQKVIDLLANVLSNYDPERDDGRLLLETVRTTAIVESSIYRLSIGWIKKEGEDVLTGEEAPSGSVNRLRMRFHLCTRARRKALQRANGEQSQQWETLCEPVISEEDLPQSSLADPWLSDRLAAILAKQRHYMVKQTDTTASNETSEWSNIFYDCDEARWFVAYRALILEPIEDDLPEDSTINAVDGERGDEEEDVDIDRGLKIWYRVKGVISAHVDVSKTDINQCDDPNRPVEADIDSQPENTNFTRTRFERDHSRHLQQSSPSAQLEIDSLIQKPNEVVSEATLPTENSGQQVLTTDEHLEKSISWIVLNLYGTHKCHNENSKCEFKAGHGMFRGGYQCSCKDGFHSAVTNLGPTFNGTAVEQSFQEKNPSYVFMFVCKRCAVGCDVCVDESPCLSSYDWGFRISLLTITVCCIIFVFILAFNIYRYRRLKVIKVASPIFLCITLLGCAIMYCETVAIFPVLDAGTCVLTKWTRNFGFCITYSALLLKTWRVSLTYRVKSAHKIKLTDKQLLQWLFPILLVMAIYLGAWTISDTPQAVYIVDWNNLKFKQCDYNWWDHSLLIGEFFFLLWGIKVCYNVRNAESLFNEAKYITWAIYNITIVNIIMILIHLSIVPNSGPDIKYFFGFVRTQLSTTTTVILIFGPKFYRVIKGQGDLWDTQIRARGIAASFSFNGVGLAHEETTDLYQENEELKEEIQKLAAQLEIMKICQMEFKNRHLKKHQNQNLNLNSELPSK